jgi:hypothetical protein
MCGGMIFGKPRKCGYVGKLMQKDQSLLSPSLLSKFFFEKTQT